MNVVFWLGVIAALVFLWFCLSFAFRGVGGFVLRLFKDVKETMKEEKENSENEG